MIRLQESAELLYQMRSTVKISENAVKGAWSYRRAHEERAGVPLAKLRELVAEGYIQPTDLVRSGANDHWIAAASSVELIGENIRDSMPRNRIEVGGLIFNDSSQKPDGPGEPGHNGTSRGLLDFADDRESLIAYLARSTRKTPTILDGTFADAVTVVQSRRDSAVYQAAWDAMWEQQSTEANGVDRRARRRRNMLFVPAGGAQGICDLAEFYRSMKLPVALIVDLDLALDKEVLGRLIAIARNRQTTARILELSRRLMRRLRSTPGLLTVAQAKKRLIEFSDSLNDSNSCARKLLHKLSALAGELDVSRALKTGGIDRFKNDSELSETLRFLIDACKAVGVFLVPVGAVENWSPELKVDTRATHSSLREADDLMAFIAEVADFHDVEA
jgi:hypothetical protein